MRKSVIARLIAVTASLMLAALGTLNSGVGTRPVRAFSFLTVTNTADSGAGSLRDAINSAASGDTIVFNLPLPAAITLTTGEIPISNSLTISGPGANLLTVSGNNSSRAFNVGVGTTVSISGLTIAHGSQSFFGGAIFSKGMLSVTSCIFSNNTSGGGAIAGVTQGNLTVAGCTFVGNSSSINGGAILATGVPCMVANSTFTANSAANGGAIAANDQATIVNSTLSGNSAEPSSGGGIFLHGSLPVTLVNTIIAGSTGGDCTLFLGATIGTNSHNLIQDGSCNPMLSGNPMLGPLQNNGGPTPTMALLAGSPAIDAGDDSVLGSPLFLTTDQRGAGFLRKLGPHVDIGAFEFQVSSFDTCLKDNSTGNLFQFNSTTGQYLFTRCSDSFTLSGTGTVALVSGVRMLRDVKADRKISAGFSTAQLTGSVTIYLKVGQGIWQLFRINDTNPSAVCNC